MREYPLVGHAAHDRNLLKVALCGVRRVPGWSGIMLPAANLTQGQLSSNKLVMLCEDCMAHPDLPLAVLEEV
jgi:hypothetical protein